VQFWPFFNFALGGFQCTENAIFVPKDLKLGKTNTKKKTF